MSTSRKIIHKALIKLRDKVNAGTMIHCDGICGNLISMEVPDSIDVVDHYSKKWPNHSRSRYYPVESAGCDDYYSYKDRWNHPIYGPRRRELLNFLIRATR